ncbi:MAG: hypothetical protein NVS4B12_26420 [Ktedonobacteraceae bacterium]
MSKQFAETNGRPDGYASPRGISSATYSARIQEVMRYNKLYSSDYPFVMTILNAVTRGRTQEQWQEEQQRRVTTLTNQAPDQARAHVDAANRYEQTISNLQDLLLWPW